MVGFNRETPVYNRRMVCACAAGIFVVSFLIHTWHHFYLFPDKFMFLWDGQSYLETCSNLTKVLIEILRGNIYQAINISTEPEFIKRILHDGPVLALVPAAVFAVLNHPPSAIDWQTFVGLTAVLQSFSAVLLFVLTLRITASFGWSIAAALLFCLNPSVILASGRYLTEPWTVPCLLAFVFLSTGSSEPKHSIAFRALAGLFAGLAVLLRAVLVPGIVVVAFIAAFGSDTFSLSSFNWRRCLVRSAPVLVGAFMAIAPWYSYTYHATGDGFLLVPRMVAYNAAVRLDVGSDAWCTLPQSEFVSTMLSKPDFLAAQLQETASHAPELIAITVRKVGRLISHPWNETRRPIFNFITAKMQEMIHQCLLVFSILGIALFFSRIKWSPVKLSFPETVEDQEIEGARRTASLILKCSLAIMAGHFFYLIFQATSRNFFTMLPFVILFAVLGLRSAIAYIRSFYLVPVETSQVASNGKRAGVGVGCLAAMLILTWILCSTETLGLPWEGFEKSTVIEPGKSFDISFEIPRISNQSKIESDIGALLLLIDADANCQFADVSLNGKHLEQRFLPVARFSSDWYLQSKQLRVHSIVLGIPQSDLRQWRAIALPSHLVRRNGTNQLSLMNRSDKGITVYGACKSHSFLPSPSLFASDFMLNSMSSLDLRIPQRVHPDGAKPTFGDGTLGLHLLIAPAVTNAVSAAKEVDAYQNSQEFVQELSLTSFPPDAISLSQTLRLDATTAPKPGSLSGSLVVPAMPIANYVKVQLSGRARLNSGDGRIGVKLLLVNADGTKFMPLAFPDYVTVSPGGWSEFKFQDYVPTSVLGGAVRAVIVELSPVPISQSEYGAPAGSSDVLIKELEVNLQPIEAMDLSLGH